MDDLSVHWFSDKKSGNTAKSTAECLREQDPENTFKDLGSGMEILAHVDGALVCRDQRPIGFFVLNVMDETFELYKLYVAPEERRNGSGTAIVDWVVDWGRERGMRKMFVEFNARSHSFWTNYVQGKRYTSYGDRFSIDFEDEVA